MSKRFQRFKTLKTQDSRTEASTPEVPESGILETTSKNAENTEESGLVELTTDLVDLPADEKEARRKVLKQMLSTNEARQQAALLKRQPDMAIGDRVSIAGGEFHTKQASVLDADFIHSRALLNVDGVAEPVWVPFNSVRRL